jgi:alanine-glyoxylate transaminase / serine-glyoxylate transaminase / serine-pyruvate transaminase
LYHGIVLAVPSLPERTLFGPGPSDVAPSVLEAMSRPVIGHLDPAFVGLLDEIGAMLRDVFVTSNDVTFAASGTGSAGMEMALVNLLEPGDRAVVGVAGVFGERLAEIARRSGADVEEVRTEWGSPIASEAIRDALQGAPAKIVALVHAETSTGMRQPIEDVARIAREHGALVVVDAVTSLAGIPLFVDDWGIDVCYSGTQKCLSVPPGLAPITFSPRAMAAIGARSTPVRSWYLDVGMITRYWGSERVYHHTAPISMIYGLHEGLRLVLEEGLEARWERHRTLGEQLQRELVGLGFELLAADGFRLPQLTAAALPDGIDERAARKRLLDEFGIEVGGGLGAFAGKAWRIGLMGESCRKDKLDRLLGAIRTVTGR